MKNITTLYSSRVWLNEAGSLSTGNVCAFDGRVTYAGGQEYIETQLRISDCSKTAVLHQADYDNREDFISKMELLHEEIGKFIAHLKSTPNELNNGEQVEEAEP